VTPPHNPASGLILVRLHNGELDYAVFEENSVTFPKLLQDRWMANGYDSLVTNNPA
jgi:hypothetical protein